MSFPNQESAIDNRDNNKCGVIDSDRGVGPEHLPK